MLCSIFDRIWKKKKSRKKKKSAKGLVDWFYVFVSVLLHEHIRKTAGNPAGPEERSSK